MTATEQSRSNAGLRRRSVPLTLRRIDPWSMTKTAFVMSSSLAIITIVAICLLWLFLNLTGFFASVGGTVSDLVGGAGSSVSLTAFLSFPRVLGISMLIGAIEIVLVSAMAALYAVIFNLTADMTGGLEVVLTQDEPSAQP